MFEHCCPAQYTLSRHLHCGPYVIIIIAAYIFLATQIAFKWEKSLSEVIRWVRARMMFATHIYESEAVEVQLSGTMGLDYSY